MRTLDRLRQHVAAGHREILAGKAGIGLENQHIGNLFGSFDSHRAFLFGRNGESAELHARRAFADAEIDPAAGNDVERRETLRRARGMVVVGDDLADAVPETDGLGARGGGGEKHFGSGGMRVFVEKMMLDLPRIVISQLIGKRDLVERLVKQARLVAGMPGARQLQLVEYAEFHVTYSPSTYPHAQREGAERRYRRLDADIDLAEALGLF